MFECLVGWPPFCAEDAHDTYRKIVNWRQMLYFPEENPLLDDEQGRQQWPDAERCIRGCVQSINPFPSFPPILHQMSLSLYAPTPPVATFLSHVTDFTVTHPHT